MNELMMKHSGIVYCLLFIASKTTTGQGPLSAAVQMRMQTQKHNQSHTSTQTHSHTDTIVPERICTQKMNK